jgi:hypothetical protein
MGDGDLPRGGRGRGRTYSYEDDTRTRKNNGGGIEDRRGQRIEILPDITYAYLVIRQQIQTGLLLSIDYQLSTNMNQDGDRRTSRVTRYLALVVGGESVGFV